MFARVGNKSTLLHCMHTHENEARKITRLSTTPASPCEPLGFPPGTVRTPRVSPSASWTPCGCCGSEEACRRTLLRQEMLPCDFVATVHCGGERSPRGRAMARGCGRGGGGPGKGRRRHATTWGHPTRPPRDRPVPTGRGRHDPLSPSL